MELYGWQRPLEKAIVTSLWRHRVFISGFPTGSGKTILSLAAAKEIGGPHLVVAPKIARSQWLRAADSMGASNQILAVINPERLSTPQGCEFYHRVGKPKKKGDACPGTWTLPVGTSVIWDEPHRGSSGVKSQTTQALAELRAYARCLHAMSATVADSPLKLRALGWWLDLHQYHDSSFYGWCRQNGCKNKDPGQFVSSAGRAGIEFTRDPAEAVRHMTNIRRAMGERFMSIKADDIPGFPTETLGIKLVDLSERDKLEIDSAYAEMSNRMKTRAKSTMAELGRERERIEFVMAEALAELAEGHVQNGMSVVVFFSFTEPRLRFEAKLQAMGIPVATVCGGQHETATTNERQDAIDAFQRNEVHVAAVMAKAGGAALSLHDIRKERPRVSYTLPAYEADLIRQCLGRIRRCEGTHATQFFVIAAGTIQERVAASLERKLGNMAALNESDLIPIL
jgi:hypothetical protein